MYEKVGLNKNYTDISLKPWIDWGAWGQYTYRCLNQPFRRHQVSEASKSATSKGLLKGIVRLKQAKRSRMFRNPEVWMPSLGGRFGYLFLFCVLGYTKLQMYGNVGLNIFSFIGLKMLA